MRKTETILSPFFKIPPAQAHHGTSAIQNIHHKSQNPV